MSEDNPLVMYIVVRKDLPMSTGKIAAQCCHSTGYLFLRYAEIKSSKEGFVFKAWMNEGHHRKVVLGVSDGEWAKLKEEYCNDLNIAITTDAGFTEIPSGTETCMAIWPQHKQDAPKILKRLQTLK